MNQVNHEWIHDQPDAIVVDIGDCESGNVTADMQNLCESRAAGREEAPVRIAASGAASNPTASGELEELLLRLLDDGEPYVVKEAAESAQGSMPSRIRTRLEEIADSHPVHYVRRTAEAVLGRE